MRLCGARVISRATFVINALIKEMSVIVTLDWIDEPTLSRGNMPTDGNKPTIDAALVKKLARLLDQTGLTEIEYGEQDWHLRVSKNVAAPAITSVSGSPHPAAAPATPGWLDPAAQLAPDEVYISN